MKKIIALFLMMTAVFCVFAVDTSVYLDTPTDKVNIGFAEDNDKALAGTSASSDFHLGSIPLTADLKFAETTYSNIVFIFQYIMYLRTNWRYTHINAICGLFPCLFPLFAII